VPSHAASARVARAKVPSRAASTRDAPAAVAAPGTAGHDVTDTGMDRFDRTFLAAAVQAALPSAAVARHLPVLRRWIDPDQTVLLLVRCALLDRPHRSDHLMMLTRERLVVTSESRLLHRARPHLDTAVADMTHARWEPDPAGTSIEFTATASDGVRERFLIAARRRDALWQLDATFAYVFRPSGVRRFNPVGAPVTPAWMNPVASY
jgi:hypothetical protein